MIPGNVNESRTPCVSDQLGTKIWMIGWLTEYVLESIWANCNYWTVSKQGTSANP